MKTKHFECYLLLKMELQGVCVMEEGTKWALKEDIIFSAKYRFFSC